VLKPLIQYSLIHRDRKSKSYDIHRLVQAVLKDGMDDATKREWVGRVVKTVARAFPNVDDISFSEWDRIERLLPHAQACIELIEQWQLDFLESVQLLNFVGRYLRQHSRLSELAVLYIDQGRYDEAETVLLRAVRNEKDTLRREHPRLSNLYNLQSDSTNAEVLYSRSLAIGEKILGSDHPRIVDILIELGEFYRQTHKPFKGEPLLRRAIMILRKTLGVDHPSVVSAMMSHAELLRSLNRKGEAQKIYAQAMKIQTKLNKERRKKEIGPAS
jgi:tetratricopeptide (TPR) repeat protein